MWSLVKESGKDIKEILIRIFALFLNVYPLEVSSLKVRNFRLSEYFLALKA